MSTILIILVLIFIFGGGGYYAHGRYGGSGLGAFLVCSWSLSWCFGLLAASVV